MRLGWGGCARGILVVLAAALAVFTATLNGEEGSALPIDPLVAAPSFRPTVLSAGAVNGALRPARRAARSCVAQGYWGVRRDDLAIEVARMVNSYRARIGLRRLQLEVGLMRSAVWKAQHMAYYFYFGHADPAPPVNRGVPQRLAACGFGGGGSENIAYGFDTPHEVVRAWLRSPGHRRNIRARGWRYLGVGVAESYSGGTFWAQNFG